MNLNLDFITAKSLAVTITQVKPKVILHSIHLRILRLKLAFQQKLRWLNLLIPSLLFLSFKRINWQAITKHPLVLLI